MTATEFEKVDAIKLVRNDAPGLIARVDTATKLRELEPCWRLLETSGLVTPYQTFDWISAWVDGMAESLRIEPLIVAMRDQRGRVLALLPLGVQTKRGLRIAKFLGGRHANMNLPLLERSASAQLSANDMHNALAVVAERHDVDLFHLEHQPLTWGGCPNPLMTLPHQPSSSSAWKTKLLSDPDEMIKGLMSSESRKKLRHKERKLSDLGTITYREARDPDEVRAVLQVFFSQKTQRFNASGIANPFAEKAVRDFLERGVTAGLPESRASIVLHAMRAGDRILSVFGGAIHQGRYTGMFTSFDTDPVVSKYSPGDLLLLNLMREMCTKGVAVFDLGTGDAAYKNDYCETEEPLAESFLPFTFQGRAAALVLKGAMTAKRQMKKSPAMAGLLPLLRKLKRR